MRATPAAFLTQVVIFLAIGLAALGPGRAAANTDRATGHPGDLCTSAAIDAADRHGVPRDIMLAITLTETRRRHRGRSGPWPWTLNIAGRGAYFDAREDALAEAHRAVTRGQRSVDIGCFQLNYRWHGENFASIEAMMAPRGAADYAARWMAELYAETGDWVRAAGHYHSRTPRHGRKYRRLIARALGEVSDHMPSDGAPRVRVAAAAPAAGAALFDRASAPAPEPLRIAVADRNDALAGGGTPAAGREADRRVGGREAPILGYAAPPPRAILPETRRPAPRGSTATAGGVRLTALLASAGPLFTFAR